MKTLAAIGTITFGFTMIGLLQPAQSASSIRDQLVGTWMLITNSDKNSDGTPKWGNNPKGSLIFEANGRYSFIIIRSDLPKFAANSADKGTPEENASVVRGSFANFGTFTVDEGKRTFSTSIEASIYPNITGKSLARTITAIGPNELRYTNATTATGAAADVVWRKVSP